MISQEETLILKELLGTRYTIDVQAYLLQNGKFSTGADTYSSSFIRNVLYGRKENLHIEEALWEIYGQRQAQKELVEQRKHTILTKKPVSGHSQA